MNASTEIGDWKMFSWIAFRRTPHSAHRETTSRSKSCFGNISCRLHNHYFGLSSPCSLIRSTSSSGAKAHTLAAIGQRVSACFQVSTAPQIAQVSSVAMCRCFKTVSVGIDCRARRHTKTFSFEGTWMCQIINHLLVSLASYDAPLLPSSWLHGRV